MAFADYPSPMNMFHPLRLLLFFGLCATARVAFGQAEPVPLDKVEEGVYSLYDHEKMTEEQRRGAGYYQTTIVELKDGHFRYWFRSDLKSPGEEPHYPLTGEYKEEGGIITIVVSTGSWKISPSQPPRDFQKTEKWQVMKYDGQVLLWPVMLRGVPVVAGRPPHNVLLRTTRTPEEIWKQEG